MDIEDILSELGDSGFNIDVKPLGGIITGCINIIITRNEVSSANFRLTFTYDDLVNDVMDRLFDYCNISKLETHEYQLRIVDNDYNSRTPQYHTFFVKYKDVEDYIQDLNIERIHIQLKEKQVPFWQKENN